MVSPGAQEEERQFEVALRPTTLADFAGQPHVREQLSIAIEAAKHRGEAMDHVLLCGPPGLGKTTLAAIVAHELSVPLDQTAGPILQKKLDLTGILSNVRARQVFFVDEIHRLQPDVEEILYSALEDFRLDILTHMAGFAEEAPLFANLGKHEIFTPAKTYPPMTVRELSALDETPKEAA